MPCLALLLAACGSSKKAPMDAAVNSPPVITSLVASPPTVPQGGQATLLAVAADPDGDALTYAWTLPTGWTFADPTKNTQPSVTIVAPNQPGAKATITLTVSDGHGLSATGTVVVATPAANGPVLSSVSAVPNLVKQGGTVNLAASASSPSGLALTYAWAAGTGWTITPSMSGTTATMVAPMMDNVNTTVTVTVTDTVGNSVTGSVLVATSNNSAPVLNSLSVDASHVLPGDVIHALASATDPDGDTLTYAWTSSAMGWTIAGTGNAITITAPNQNGSSTQLTVTVTDGLGGSTSGSVLLSTAACGAGAANCDHIDANGCETDITTTMNCGGCGIACGTGQVCDHGSVCRAPQASCEAIMEKGESLGDGVYYILPTGATSPIAVYCDMTTDGGGWTGFYAGINGEPNAFNHFELASRDCTDPTNHCMQRIPSDQNDAEIMATCGGAKLGFHTSSQVFNYFANGSESGFVGIGNQRVIAGTLAISMPAAVWTAVPANGDPYPGFIIGTNPVNTFMSTGNTNNRTGNGDYFSYCNGTFDKTSPIALFYRTKVARLEVVATINQTQGAPFDITVTAYDPAGVQLTNFADTVHFTASNADVTLPADYAYVAGDAGSHTFQPTLTGTGTRTITVTDTANPAVSTTITVQTQSVGTAATPATSCLAILNGGASGGDGLYWLDTGSGAFTALCDMTTDGGGWTGFFAGKNGNQNVFDYFENQPNDCSDPRSQCMRSIPTVIGDADVLATCGSAKAAFAFDTYTVDYFGLGQQMGWVPVTPRAISGSPDLTDFTAVYTGENGISNGFILGNTSTNVSFFSQSDDGNHNYCNGVADQQSPAFLYYREHVADHLVVTTDRTAAANGALSLTVTVVDKNGDPIPSYTGTVAVTSSDTGATLPASYTFQSTDQGSTILTGYTMGASATGTITITVTDTTTSTLTGNAKVVVGGLGSPAMAASSCSAILTGSASTGDGVYWLTDGTNTWRNYCDMTTDKGGWTLVLKANGNNTTFAYGASAWTDNSTYNTAAADFDLNEAKLASWNSVAFTQVLVEMGLDTRSIGQVEISQTNTSMFALMSPNTQVSTMLGRTSWLDLQPEFLLQPNCNDEGFNVVGSNGFSVRIGILANQENDCGSDDSRIGIGGTGASCYGNSSISVGNIAGCNPTGNASDATYGWVLVR